MIFLWRKKKYILANNSLHSRHCRLDFTWTSELIELKCVLAIINELSTPTRWTIQKEKHTPHSCPRYSHSYRRADVGAAHLLAQFVAHDVMYMAGSLTWRRGHARMGWLSRFGRIAVGCRGRCNASWVGKPVHLCVAGSRV
jgi:hypothetical protein